jgi:hypothetical protein
VVAFLAVAAEVAAEVAGSPSWLYSNWPKRAIIN